MNSPLSRVRTPLSLWSLRNRLILASVVLASFAIIASDFAANAALRTDDKNSPFKILEPLRGVPTATSITLLDIDGNLIGQVGGELGGKNFAVTGLKIAEVSQYKNRPFTIEGRDGEPDIRALAQMLPTGMGSVIVADSLEKVDKTLSQLRFLFLKESFTARLESENKLRRFVADASHELRTPLTAIRGFAELHRQGAVVGEEKTKELINRIEKESVRMSSLVEDLLLLARLDQSRELAKEPVDLNTLITEAVASARAAGPNHPIEIKLEASEIFVLGDSQRIHQVIANLLANARAHTPNGTQISITAMQGVSETTIAVSDKGPGLSKADQNRIFERFYRADPSRVRNSGEGSGLGLSIVDAVMKAHGGYVTVKSEVGQGATFTLHFLNQE